MDNNSDHFSIKININFSIKKTLLQDLCSKGKKTKKLENKMKKVF